MINPNDLLRKYQQLRAVQKEFFKNRDRNVLEKAKGLERELDRDVRDYFEQQKGLGVQATMEL